MRTRLMDPTRPLRTAELRRISGGLTPIRTDASPWIALDTDPIPALPPVPEQPVSPWFPWPIPGPTF